MGAIRGRGTGSLGPNGETATPAGFQAAPDGSSKRAAKIFPLPASRPASCPPTAS